MAKKVCLHIEQMRQNAEFSFYSVMQNFIESMRKTSEQDLYLRERTKDVEDVANRVLRNFGRISLDAHKTLDWTHILIARDFSASDVAMMNRARVKGFATELGSLHSHALILARAFGIPAVVELDIDIENEIIQVPAVLDGYDGCVILNPSEDTLLTYKKLTEKKVGVSNFLATKSHEATVTKDGKNVSVVANIELLDELPLAINNGAKGVGLYRSEYLLLMSGNGIIPGEQSQYETYLKLAQTMQPQQVVIRTFDVGGDKLIGAGPDAQEPNPFLGWRGVRVSLQRQDMFRRQLRAILRASANGNVAVLFPMISTREEIRECKEILNQCKEELRKEGVAFDEKIAVGIMIEVPAAAVCADLLAPEVDFFSFGTNDLTQYVLAVDRINPAVSELFLPTHPAILRLIKQSISAATSCGIGTSICGELAADVKYVPLILGLGVDKFSVCPQKVAIVGQALRSLNFTECAELVKTALDGRTYDEISALSLAMARKSYPELLD